MATPVLFVDHSPALGGAQHTLLLLFKHMDRALWEPHLACAAGDLAVQAQALSVAVHTIPMPRLRRSPKGMFRGVRTVMALSSLARVLETPVMVANTVRAAVFTAWAARGARVPFIWHVHVLWLSETRPRHLWLDTLGKRWLCASAARVIANSHATAGHLPCPAKVIVVHNGIEVERFDPAMDGVPFRSQYGIPQDVPVIGTVGRLRPLKGQDRFLQAMAHVAAQQPEAWFLIVGGTPFQVKDDYPQRLRFQAQRLGLASRTVFTGHLADVRPALAAMDVFVHAGDPESFGLVMVEAMAMEKPVVGFAHGASPEIVVHNETGLLVPPGDVHRLATAVLTLLADPHRRSAMGRAARRRVEEHFTARRMSRRVEAVLKSVLETSQRARPL